eukprot:CAMPEP_0113383092 /NCGR_PEP_ID=MMETSP0013_2-20120614/6181_1 /TAXON_ID=2843 ORGANISM="Skeletonema costatum, Strain 1716" /NCGR_SAMPLE_ID=MMETSP0013_2 /ASSEMBLY_ACC=CAM_ASM_000158 /LENGTH=722 /DNA_ID=CAMNT_0000265623 /DNA_START=304 /DNA_END=2472 /DNA_ORIENTATION=- /assembly_acc=CAM_ASM_000158
MATSSWIDEDTPEALRTTKSLVDGSTYHLVMSDEFNVPDRTFTDGHDPTWTALDKSDDDYSASGGGSLHFYNSSMVSTTPDGMLTIQSILEDTSWTHLDLVKKEQVTKTTHFKSGMIQSWNKFCFTGGIIEVDVILPGEPDIGGLWPAMWLLGNLGRATYEASTNNLWPWSYDKCDRKKQDSQSISACNKANHFGLNKEQGRGATEIDILELMAGDSGGALPATEPPIMLPYADLTLQVAPGIAENRPQSGSQPVRSVDHSHSGYATSVAENWYDNLTVAGNTSLNPFFYGTYLGPTKKNEPVTRSKKQAFQADAVGAMKQLGPEHFKTPHTFRLEWQPGRGGSLDWFSKSYKKVDENGTVFHMEGDGKGQDWEHSLHIPDFALDEAMGSKIPEEPSYVIFNTAISSTWAFPYNVPDWCPKCYDCYDPKCQCSFNPGFCAMMKTGKVALKIDSVRVYQSRDDDAHSGKPHSVGCDPVEFPTREYIKGFEYRYMRNPPFVYDDKHPLRDVKTGGGACKVDADCGGGGVETEDVDEDWEMSGTKTMEEVLDLDNNGGESSLREDQSPLAHLKDKDHKIQPRERKLADHPLPSSNSEEEKKSTLDKPPVSTEAVVTTKKDKKVLTSTNRKPKGQCVEATNVGLFGMKTESRKQCKCNEGYTGPHCLSIDKQDEKPGAEALKEKIDYLFEHRAKPYLTGFHIMLGGIFAGVFLAFLVVDNVTKRRK